ncbi:unnamed protein product [Rotaria sordida]|uniref:Uncharacterized protein n=1 Tax=Rotaria sordida TaxID=392033 RepID=A0A820DX14_9BILA|nr:unnamed protein product [Rotaria sordida]
MNLLSKSTCHKPSPYRPNEPWTLQQALIYTIGMFIDKSITVNEWTTELDPMYSTLSALKRNKMVHYAIYDCFAATCLIRPITLYWTFQQVTKINILDSFQALPLSSRVNNNPTNTNINQRIIKNIDDDIELISDDGNNDDDEITVNQCIKITLNNDMLYEEISNGDNELSKALPPRDNDLRVNNHSMVDDDKNNDQSDWVKYKSCHQNRSVEARRRRNRKRNDVFRRRRFRYVMTRPVYSRFTIKSIRKILRQYDISYIHTKIKQELLIIGVKYNKIKDQNEPKLPINIFS